MRSIFIALVVSALSMTSSSAEPSKAANERIVGGGGNRSLGSQILKNAKITLEVACLAKRGESVLILVDKYPRRDLYVDSKQRMLG